MIKRIVLLGLILNSTLLLAKIDNSNCNSANQLEKQVDALMHVTSSLQNDGACANPEKLKGVCDHLSEKTPANEDSQLEYVYEEKIYEASCVKMTDSDEVVAKKIQYMWSKLEGEYLKCNSANFSVQKGSLVKYAINLRNYHFLTNSIENWKINLNYIDPSDNKTPLDFLRDEMKRLKGTEESKFLEHYYSLMRKNGAKHRSEL
jgi:hypothetical protein